jgi:predicted ester cyclase
MTYRENINRIQDFLSELNNGNLTSIREFIAPEFFNYTPKSDEPTATEEYYKLVLDIKNAIPDLHVTIENLSPEGELLKGRMTLEGTHDGPIWGAPASGNHIVWEVDILVRPINDQFALSIENLAMPDLIAILRQMALVSDRLDRPPKYPVSLPEIILRVAFTGQIADKPCSHLDLIKFTEPSVVVCEPCVASGDVWPALRMCLICGFVGCCDTSENKHMKQHYEQTGHPLFRSIRLEEGWVWCYEDNAFFSKRILKK